MEKAVQTGALTYIHDELPLHRNPFYTFGTWNTYKELFPVHSKTHLLKMAKP